MVNQSSHLGVRRISLHDHHLSDAVEALERRREVARRHAKFEVGGLFFLFFRVLFGSRWELGVLLLRGLREVTSLRITVFAKPGFTQGPKRVRGLK